MVRTTSSEAGSSRSGLTRRYPSPAGVLEVQAFERPLEKAFPGDRVPPEPELAGRHPEDGGDPPRAAVSEHEDLLAEVKLRGSRHRQTVSLSLSTQEPQRQDAASASLQILVHLDGDEGEDTGAPGIHLAGDADHLAGEDLVGADRHLVERQEADGGGFEHPRQRQHQQPGTPRSSV